MSLIWDCILAIPNELSIAVQLFEAMHYVYVILL